MINPENEKSGFISTNLIEFLFMWRKPLIITTLAAIVASVIFSAPYFITPKYKSTVVMFPTSTNAISKALLDPNSGVKNDILEFGDDEQAEQMLQILNSSDIREEVVCKFNLLKHYNIDTNAKFKYTRLYREYDNNITFRRTEYMAVEISVLDKDPQMAADIANTISALLDSTKNKMQKERAMMGFKIVEASYNDLKNDIQKMEDSLTELRKLGVHDYETQAEMINQQLAIEIAKGNSRGVKALEAKLDVLAQYGGPYVSIRDALEHEKKQLSEIKAKYEEAKVDAHENLPQKFIVNKAIKAEKKSYPVRWLIVLVATLSTFLMTVMVIIILDNLSQIRLPKKKL